MEWTRLLTAVVSGCVRNRDRRLSAVLVFFSVGAKLRVICSIIFFLTRSSVVTQRGGAMLRVIGYFANSLHGRHFTAIRNYTLE